MPRSSGLWGRAFLVCFGSYRASSDGWAEDGEPFPSLVTQ